MILDFLGGIEGVGWEAACSGTEGCVGGWDVVGRAGRGCPGEGWVAADWLEFRGSELLRTIPWGVGAALSSGGVLIEATEEPLDLGTAWISFSLSRHQLVNQRSEVICTAFRMESGLVLLFYDSNYYIHDKNIQTYKHTIIQTYKRTIGEGVCFSAICLRDFPSGASFLTVACDGSTYHNFFSYWSKSHVKYHYSRPRNRKPHHRLIKQS